MTLTRRAALQVMSAGALCGAGIDSYFEGGAGAGVAVDFKTGRVIASHGSRERTAPPGSTMKPLVLAALLAAGKLKTSEVHECSGALKIAGRGFACSHPRLAAVDLPAAIAYSCNEFVARVATRFSPADLRAALARYGLGGLSEAPDRDAVMLQALGEDRISISVESLAIAYRKLAANAPAAIREGLEGAVELGTAQRASIAGTKVAGKTGTAARQYAWFAGWAPSRDPRVVVAVMVPGRAGGADAAPIGGKILASLL